MFFSTPIAFFNDFFPKEQFFKVLFSFFISFHFIYYDSASRSRIQIPLSFFRQKHHQGEDSIYFISEEAREQKVVNAFSFIPMATPGIFK